MLILYNILYIIFAICYLPFFLIRRKYHRGILMRLGFFSQSAINKLKGRKIIWLHAVSVGEVQAIDILVKDLKQQYPDFLLIISTVTKTGNSIARKLIEPQGLVIYSPLDIGFIVRKVIGLINPQAFIITETEIWPNLITNLTKKGTAAILINGRISLASFKGYKTIRPFLKGVLSKFSLFCMQTKEDAQRVIELGADENRVKITGNMKFDIQDSGFRIQDAGLKLAQNEQLFIAGSTHRGEEKIILKVYKELVKSHPNLRLLLAPRHIERTQEIERLVKKFGFESQKVSQFDFVPRPSSLVPRPVLILDTIGQLRSLYARADIVFIGGSLIRHGGQSPIEPAVFSRPILFGPYMSNFSNVAKAFLNKGAAMLVVDAQQLKNSCLKLLDSPALGKELGSRAKEVLEGNRGATLRNTQLIKQLLES